MMTDAPKKKKTAILFNSSNMYAFALYNALTSLKKNSPQLAQEAEIIIHSWHIPEHEKNLFQQVLPCRIVEYVSPIEKRTDAAFIKFFTPALYARFEAFKMLEEYERVVCIDVDVYIQKELISVFDYCKTGMAMAVDRLKTPVGSNFWHPIEGFDMNASPGFNCGIIVLTDALKRDYQAMYDFCIDATLKYINELITGDQSVMMLLIQQFNIRPDILPDAYNTMAHSSTKALKKANLIHTTGHRKFWCYYYFNEWYNTYAQWIKNGGTPAVRFKQLDSKLYEKIGQKFGWNKKVFWQIAPDPFRWPRRFLIFSVKRLLRIKY